MRLSRRGGIRACLAVRSVRVARGLGAAFGAASTAAAGRGPVPRRRARGTAPARAALLSLLNRLRDRAPVGLEAGNDFARYLALDQPFDIAQERVLVDAYQRNRLACSAGAPGSADAMHVVLRNVRQIVVHDVRQLIDVDAARGDVGGDQHLQRRSLEFRQCAGARTLTLVAVNRERGDAVLVELLGELVGAVLGADRKSVV